MARPKKSVESEKTEPMVISTELPDVGPTLSVSHKADEIAYSFYKVMNPDGTVARWEVARIMFDPASGYTKRPEIVTACDSEAEALSTFKVNVAQTILKRNR